MSYSAFMLTAGNGITQQSLKNNTVIAQNPFAAFH